MSVPFSRTGAFQKQDAPYGQGSGNIVLDDVHCTGQETSIARCAHSGFMVHYCGHHEDVGVVCCKCFLCNLISDLSSH